MFYIYISIKYKTEFKILTLLHHPRYLSRYTRHGGHWLAYYSLPRVIMMMENLVEWGLAGEPEVLGEKPPSATLSTTNPTWPDPESNPGRRGENPATNRLSYGPALGTCLS
jgi:hypothetical protein